MKIKVGKKYLTEGHFRVKIVHRRIPSYIYVGELVDQGDDRCTFFYNFQGIECEENGNLIDVFNLAEEVQL